jgi:zinc transporter ZupT
MRMRATIHGLCLFALLLASSLSKAAEAEPGAARTDAPVDHRYAFVAAGALGLAGVVFGFVAQGQQQRSQTLSSAAESARALSDARQAADTANLLYALAGASLVYAVLLEVLPESTAEKASLKFHF